jgi:N-acetyl-anhydromuramyl-L-alanine amidase AmpD
MAQSPEYPDLKWMPPKSWTDANRTSVQLVVIHTTEGAARASAAEDGASYDQRRTDGTSTHYFHDSDSTIQCVRTADQAHAARAQGNRRGIQHELCTRAGSANWSDTYHQAMLRHAAKQAARDAKKWGIPVRHLTVAQVADGVKGFCGHWDITRAFPQDNGTHTDPGGNFPWTQFLDLVRDELDGDDVSKADVTAALEEFFGGPALAQDPKTKEYDSGGGRSVWWHDVNGMSAWRVLAGTYQLAQAMATKLDVPLSQVLAAVGQVDEQVLADLADVGHSDEEVAAALRAALGDRAASVGALLTS